MPSRKKRVQPTPPAVPPQQPAHPPADNPQLRHTAGERVSGGREEALQRLRALEQMESMKAASTEETEGKESSA
jgi:hypothetical protein